MGQAVLSREELGKELAELEKQLEACCTLCTDSIQTVVSSACSLRVEGRERIEKVMERLQSLETEDSYVQTVRENQEEELHKFKQRMSETQASLDYLHKHNSLLLQKKENREKLISTLMADVTSKMSSKKQKVAALHEATTWYKQLLSMHCEYSDGKHMVFLGFRPEL
jgi:chromosome segregation ATPase